MLDFKPLAIDDKDIFDKYLKPYTFETCEYSFTNLFIWRKACDIQYSIYNDILIIKKTDFDGNYHFMQPLGYTRDTLGEVINLLIGEKQNIQSEYLIKDAEESFVHDFLDVCDGNRFSIEEDRDNFDYIYEGTSLMNLSGKKLHKKRNNYNHFIKNYEYTTSPITSDLIIPCIKAAREWCHKVICKGYLLYELRSIEEMLKNGSNLDFTGMVVLVNNRISALSIGEKVSDEMAIIHIEKADPDIRGLYNFINKSFIDNCFNNIPFINREQDLGIEGLRKAKMEYQPIKLAKKFIINNH